MAIHPLDFEIQAHVYSTPELTAIFSEKARFQRWLKIEAVLAATQASFNIIPKAAAEEISKKAKIDGLDLEEIRKGYTKSRNSLIPILKALRSACINGHGEFVHFGATTQDILDTGYVLEIKATLNIIHRELLAIETIITDLARKYRNTPMIGRTHSQQAIPITFGMKAAIWLAEIKRHNQRLISLSPRVLVGQLSGAVGSMAALGEEAMAVAKKTCLTLGLQHSNTPWHTSRDNMAEISSFYAIVTGTVAKICNEIFQLGKNEIGELREPPAGSQASSTMPHKRNPVLCERVVVLHSHIRSLNSVILEGMVHENERDPRALWSEWLALPQIAVYTGTALAYTREILGKLEVFPEKMLHNLRLYKDTIASEWLLFQLAKEIGKLKAQKELERLIKLATQDNTTIKEALLTDRDLKGYFTKNDLDMLDHPERYTGQAGAIVDAVLD